MAARLVRGLVWWVMATLLVMTPVTAVIYLGWLMRRMQAVALRRAGLPFQTPRLIFGSGSWPARLFGGLFANIRLGLSALLSLGLATAPFSVIWLLSWWAGWENSFSKGYEQAFVGPLLGLVGVGLFSAIMIWLPMALAHQAVEGRVLAAFEVRKVRSAVRHSGWGYVFLAIATVVAALPIFAVRGLVVFASDLVPGFDDMNAEQINALRTGILIASSAYIVVVLYMLRSWAGAIYARAVSQALLGRDASLWVDSALSDGVSRGTRSWTLIHWVRIALLAVIWFGLSTQIYVGQFLNHDWHLWLTHPLLVLPWIG